MIKFGKLKLKKLLKISEGRMTVYSLNRENYVFDTDTSDISKFSKFINKATVRKIMIYGHYNIDVITYEKWEPEV